MTLTIALQMRLNRFCGNVLVDVREWEANRLRAVIGEVDKVLSENKSAFKEWMKEQGLHVGYLLGAVS
jgi:hypothetical protein